MSAVDRSEWEGIFLAQEKRPVMSFPPRMKASRKLVIEVRDALHLDSDAAEAAADWIADKMERFGAFSAHMSFDADGDGPMCSWCGMVWPLCGHHHLSGWDSDEPEPADAPA